MTWLIKCKSCVNFGQRKIQNNRATTVYENKLNRRTFSNFQREYFTHDRRSRRKEQSFINNTLIVFLLVIHYQRTQANQMKVYYVRLRSSDRFIVQKQGYLIIFSICSFLSKFFRTHITYTQLLQFNFNLSLARIELIVSF